MRFAIVNLPNKDRLTRRYMCSYISPVSLFPPLELLSATAALENAGVKNIYFADAVAEQWNNETLCAQLQSFAPDYIITLTGFECFDDDMQYVKEIKQTLSQSKIIVFGHYPTIFTQEVLEKSAADYVIQGEPEYILMDFVNTIQNNTFIHEIEGLFALPYQAKALLPRIQNITELPQPAYDKMDARKYFEPFMPRPFAMIQSARGCPYRCNYCVKSYGSRLTLRSAEQVIEELQMLKDLHGIRSFRFIDDTFTINKKRVLDICKLMVEKKLNLQWTCLSRTDNIQDDILKAMKQAGCQRIYFGLESGSQRMLDFYEKNVDVKEALIALKKTRAAGIETTGFFMLGMPQETEQDFQDTLQFALEADLSLASIGGITLYPGTPLFDANKDLIEFSLFPYVNHFKDIAIEERYLRWEKLFYNAFFRRPSYLWKLAKIYGSKPIPVYETIKDALTYRLQHYDFMPGIKRQHQVIMKQPLQ